ncbi:uncharacterized protein TNIN_69551 [Trichonephila inaurata madagascariensis]|uniref:Membrane glycoprotein lig-1 n=1 Tax=Trichonephila inaurata madagascariensis TaxID=2747483 RepID=A0A8X7BTR7_9ARAC|nr:uncharacterized protein TNIN_69551 [Trichonephila inaurata madagascariensis]
MWYGSIVIALLLPVASLAASIASPERCPVTNTHCRCVFKGPFYSLKCNSVREMSDFKAIVESMDVNAVILELDSLHLDFLPLNALYNSSVHTLIVSNSTFQKFHNSSEVQPSVVNLHHLSLENVTFHENAKWKHFMNLTNLQVLFVYNSTVENSINANFNRYLSKGLVSITVAESNLTSIERDSLASFKNLTSLRVSHNNVRTFSRDVLPQASKVEQLRLDSNKIHSLPAGVFANMTHLKLVSLSNNTISNLSEDVFGPLWRSDMHLDLRGNPLKCDNRMLWTVQSESRPKRVIGKCVHPKQHFGKNVEDLTGEDLGC